MKSRFSRKLLLILIFTITEFSTFLGSFHAFSQDTSPSWYILDIINPTLDSVEWIEKGNYSKPPSWISDGRWYEAHSRQNLVEANDIFVSLSESLNWTAVNEWLYPSYSSFEEFETNITKNPSWWLKYSWNLDVNWYGISLNSTMVRTEFDPETSTAEIYIWCRITKTPEYILAEERLETFLTGFDLTLISIGNLEALQWYEDYTTSGRYYYVYFKAPSNLMSQNKTSYSLVLDVSPLYRGETYNVEQEIQIFMPSDTEVQEASPSSMASWTGNTVKFTIHRGDTYPASFSVSSAPPVKDVTQRFLEAAGRWMMEPTAWVAIGTLILLLYTAFHGRHIWSRRKTYYRLYRSMVTLYDHYSLNLAQFHQEMENMSRSIHKYFIENKITDDQFEKLLTQRDNMIERAKKLIPPSPPPPS